MQRCEYYSGHKKEGKMSSIIYWWLQIVSSKEREKKNGMCNIQYTNVIILWIYLEPLISFEGTVPLNLCTSKLSTSGHVMFSWAVCLSQVRWGMLLLHAIRLWWKCDVSFLTRLSYVWTLARKVLYLHILNNKNNNLSKNLNNPTIHKSALYNIVL